MARKERNIVLQSVEVTDYAAEGKSLARVDGKVIFIDGGVPGDIVDVRIGKNKKDWAEGDQHHRLSNRRVDLSASISAFALPVAMLPYEQQLVLNNSR
jgi:23S rRNA (uracil1939-C5)-methyltransferase